MPAARRDLAAALRSSVGTSGGPTRKDRPKGGRRAAQDDAEIAALRRQLRAHPCHSCPDREEHARWAERWARLAGEHDALVARIAGRTGSIAAVFDRICDILLRLGYLTTTTDDAGRAALQVTDDGRWLRRLYAENDLLLAECLRRGVFDELDAPGLAAAVSTLVYRSRRDDQGEPRIPGGPNSRLGVALDACVRAWSELDDLETAHKVETIQPLDAGLVEAVHRWAAGRSLGLVGFEGGAGIINLHIANGRDALVVGVVVDLDRLQQHRGLVTLRRGRRWSGLGDRRPLGKPHDLGLRGRNIQPAAGHERCRTQQNQGAWSYSFTPH